MSLRSRRSRSIAPLFIAAVFALPNSLTAQQPATPAPAQARPATHTVKRGDTLWDLAKLYLGDPFLWPEIYRLNTDLIEDPHWIYPGEVLKLPGETPKVVAVAPVEPAPATPTPPTAAPVRPAPTTPTAIAPATPPAVDTINRIQAPRPPAPTVRSGEYIAAPWIDQRGGPRGSGSVVGARDVPGIESADRSRLNLFDQVLVAPPAGSAGVDHALYLTYSFGPLIEDMGQVVIPTGIIRITRPAQNGEYAIGQVVKLFSQMQQGQHLIPLDSAAAVGFDQPRAIANGPRGTVRWIYQSPVLPSVQDYVLLDLTTRQAARTGDRVELFIPRQKPTDVGELAVPELPVATAQVLRVTPFGSTAVILHQDQPKIEEGTAARITAKMP